MAKSSKRATFTCPCCGTAYRYKNMAEHCVKTKLCRIYNAPSEDRRNALVMQVGVAAVVQFIIQLLMKTDGEAATMAKGVDESLAALYQDFGYLQCNMRYVEDVCGRVVDTLTELWPLNEDTDAIHMLSVAGALIIEMRQDLAGFWERHPRLAAAGIWQDIEDELDKIFAYFNADLSEDYVYAERVPEALDKLRAVIWPVQPAKQPAVMRLFLVNERYWVVAKDRTQAKGLVSEQYACAVTSIEGIKPSETFEDGASPADLLALAEGRPAIVGISADNV